MKRKWIKTLATALVMLMVLSLFPAAGFAGNDPAVAGIDGDGNVTVNDGKKDDATYDEPNTDVNSVTVTADNGHKATATTGDVAEDVTVTAGGNKGGTATANTGDVGGDVTVTAENGGTATANTGAVEGSVVVEAIQEKNNKAAEAEAVVGGDVDGSVTVTAGGKEPGKNGEGFKAEALIGGKDTEGNIDSLHEVGSDVTVTSKEGGEATVTTGAITGDVEVTAEGQGKNKKDSVTTVTVGEIVDGNFSETGEITGNVTVTATGEGDATLDAGDITGAVAVNVKGDDSTVAIDVSDIKATGDAVTIEIKDDEESTVNITAENVTATGEEAKGIVVDVTGGSSANKTNIVIEDTLTAGTPVELAAGAEENVTLTVWKIDGGDEHIVNASSDEAVAEFEGAVNYIVKVADDFKTKVTTSTENGNSIELSDGNTYQTANEDEKVTVALTLEEGEELEGIYYSNGDANTFTTTENLVKDGGNYIIKMLRKGAMMLGLHLGSDHVPETIPGKPATCTEPGLTDGEKCSVCGKILKEQEVIPATNHKYTSEVTQEPTCTEPGVRTYTCSNTGCGHSYTEEIPTIDHTPGETVIEKQVEPGPGVEGSYDEVVYCSVCNHELSRNTVKVAALPVEEPEEPAKEESKGSSVEVEVVPTWAVRIYAAAKNQKLTFKVLNMTGTTYAICGDYATAMNKRTDVEITIVFLKDGQQVALTIPAGTDVVAALAAQNLTERDSVSFDKLAELLQLELKPYEA